MDTPENSVPCSGMVNRAKLNWSKEKFIEMCCAVAKIHGKEKELCKQ
jgi:hypothetical protein